MFSSLLVSVYVLLGVVLLHRPVLFPELGRGRGHRHLRRGLVLGAGGVTVYHRRQHGRDQDQADVGLREAAG